MNLEQITATILIVIASVAIIASRFYAIRKHFYNSIVSNAYDDYECC